MTSVFPSEPLTRADVDTWEPDHWRRRQERWSLSGKGPMVVKVCLRPKLDPSEDIPNIDELNEIAGPLQVSMETRPRAHLSGNPRVAHSPLVGGVSIGLGATDYGTLGVILVDGAAKRYGITCAHVASPLSSVLHPARRDSRGAVSVGSTVLAQVPLGSTLGTRCNPWSGAAVNEIDIALIDLDCRLPPATLEILDIGPLSGVAQRAFLSTGQTLDVMGRTCRRQSMQVGGLAAWYSFQRAGMEYCFKNLFEVQSPFGTPGVIGPGDSGAAACVAGAAGSEWAGVITGADGLKGYAAYAETIQSWLSGQGYQLAVM